MHKVLTIILLGMGLFLFSCVRLPPSLSEEKVGSERLPASSELAEDQEFKAIEGAPSGSYY